MAAIGAFILALFGLGISLGGIRVLSWVHEDVLTDEYAKAQAFVEKISACLLVLALINGFLALCIPLMGTFAFLFTAIFG